ncbi:MAG: Ig-like domain-containing protein, partial [Pseudarcicella sp.]|nr:Ig-like domain-containing protein [Pseudarcicella sp.]
MNIFTSKYYLTHLMILCFLLCGGKIKAQCNENIDAIDNPDAFGIDSWIGHVYDWNSTTNLHEKYLGFRNFTQNFSEGFGGDNACFSVTNASVPGTTVNSQTFFVRFRMRTTQAGCFFATGTSDDGFRLIKNGVTVYSDYTDHPARTHNMPLSLVPNDDLVIEFYEEGGKNVVSWNMRRFSGDTSLPSPAQSICLGTPATFTSPPLGGLVGTYSSSNTSIATVDPSTGLITGVSGGSVNITYTVSNGSCLLRYVKPVIISIAVTSASQPPNPICPGGNGTFSVTTNPATATAYQWQYFNGSTFVNVSTGTPAGVTYTGANTASLAVSTTNVTTPSGTYQYRCVVTGCGGATTNSSTLNLVVNPEPSPPTATKNPNLATVCVNTSLTLTSPTLGAGGSGTQSFNYSTTSAIAGFSAAVPTITPSVPGVSSIWIRTVPTGAGCDNSIATQYSWTSVARPTATAGGSQTICKGASATVSGANATNGTILWTHNGTGTLSGANTLTPIYTSTNADAGTTVTLTMTVSNSPCANATATYSVVVRPSIVSTISTQTNVLCFGGNNGSVVINSTGGTSPYSISPSTTSLTAGAKTFTITDANGCTTTVNATITEPAAALSSTLVSQVDVLCFGGNTGSVTINTTGGTSPYSISPATTSLTAGAKTFTITDANGCTTTVNATITEPVAALSSNLVSQVDVLCFGGNTGSVTINT